MLRSWITIWLSTVAVVTGCGSGDSAGPETSSGTMTQAPPGPCDKTGNCGKCQQCAYADGGQCSAQVTTCEANAECVAINDCLKGCLAVGGAAATWDACYAGCADAHVAGKSDYAAVVSCIAADACTYDCQF